MAISIPATLAALPAAVGDAYTPGDMSTDLLAGAATVLPWVGVAVAAGIGLMFAFMGIRKGLAFFRGVAK
jgi:hypothetical protein